MDEVLAALEALPEDCREVIVLKHRSGMSYAELARHFGIAVPEVAERICRARVLVSRRLRDGQ
jgi:DNA-directed RNA polymerase specialized sigma24 family protein